jgi:quinol monooxygenase YgiN
MKDTTMFQTGHFVTAELRVKDPHKVDEAIRALSHLCAATRDEAGCQIFLLHQDQTEPTRLLLWERFNDAAALQQHFKELHTLEYLALDLTEIVQAIHSRTLA